jgi:hypothetical protein
MMNKNQMAERRTPTRQGQIVRTVRPIPGEEPHAAYLLAEDPSQHGEGRLLRVYGISEILRKNATGEHPLHDLMAKGEMTVVGESLKEWVEGWNH